MASVLPLIAALGRELPQALFRVSTKAGNGVELPGLLGKERGEGPGSPVTALQFCSL